MIIFSVIFQSVVLKSIGEEGTRFQGSGKSKSIEYFEGDNGYIGLKDFFEYLGGDMHF